MRTIATDVARNVARLSEMPLSEGADSRGHKKPSARFTKYLTTILRLSYDNTKVTTDFR